MLRIAPELSALCRSLREAGLRAETPALRAEFRAFLAGRRRRASRDAWRIALRDAWQRRAWSRIAAWAPRVPRAWLHDAEIEARIGIARQRARGSGKGVRTLLGRRNWS
jgi:hypothetical protein